MRKWWHVSPKRVVIAVVVVFTLMWMAGKAAEWLAPRTEARSMLRNYPELAQLPVPLPDQSLATLSDNPLVFFGLTVYTPWGRFGTIQSAPGIAMIPFPERHLEMILYKPQADSFEKAMWDNARPVKSGISGYQLMAAEMAATPDQLKLWKGPSRNEASSFLLEMKQLILGDMRAIYAISAGEFRGFQEGNPTDPPYRVRLDLFDSADYHYQIVISAKGGSGPTFSQAEVNPMVASVKPLPHN